MKVSGRSFQAANSFVKFFRIISRTLPVLLLTLAALALAGCAGTDDEEGDEGGKVSITAGLESISPASITPMVDLGTPADVLSIRVDVTETAGGAFVQTGPLSESKVGLGDWAAIMSSLPVGIDLDFDGAAYDKLSYAGILIFEGGVSPVNLALGVLEPIVLPLAAIQGPEPTLPIIGGMSAASSFAAGSPTNPISWGITYGSAVVFSVSVSNGDVTPASGTITDPSSEDLVVNYAPPIVAGTYSITATVWDPATPDNTVAQTASLLVTDEGSGDITVVFGPSITGIHFVRSASALDVTIDVVAENDVEYAWSGTGDFGGLTGALATVSFPFSNSSTGTITVDVTDTVNGIATTLTHTIDVGDFPY